MKIEKELADLLRSISGSIDPVTVFNDFCTVSALSISNSCNFRRDDIWQAREQEYLRVMSKYSDDAKKKIYESFGLLCVALENDPKDILGTVFMNIGANYGGLGQFFTPFHLSVLCAEISLQEADLSKEVLLNEPSCGGGGMIIATACVMKKRGINYQKKMRVVAQDLDWKAVYMCYTQLSLLGIKATVVQGSTLTDPYSPINTNPRNIFRTPAEVGVLC